MKKIKVGINGFGRIGRAFFKLAHGQSDLSVVAVNDLGDVANFAYLLKYDSVYGRSPFDISVVEAPKRGLVVDGEPVAFLSEPNPENLPWKEFDVDVAVESTGRFSSVEKAAGHLRAGARRVVITAPLKEQSQTSADLTQTNAEKADTVLVGVNEEKLKTCRISSNASCTTNAGSPILEIMRGSVGIEKALLNTVHAYTAGQSLVDGPATKDFRRGRAASHNIAPSGTGAAAATTEAIPELRDKFDGIAIRVPAIAGSIADITFVSKRPTTRDEINSILKRAAGEARWRGIFAVTEEPIVSTDIIGSLYASIADLSMTRVVGGNLVKVLTWYDNEMGYAHTLVEHVLKAGEQLQ
jgi:glyceraldehyde 3-phosphate dehydrogenase